MLHDHLVKQGMREACEIALVLPLDSPIPPSPDTSRALVAAFAERDIKFVPNRRVASVDTARNVAVLDDGAQMPFDLFLGVPKHCVPPVVLETRMAENGWIPVNPRTLETRYENVYAVGDCANTGTPKAGVFAEGMARAVASALIAKLRQKGDADLYDGFGTCYIEFGGGRVGKVEVDWFSGPAPTGKYYEPSVAVRADKEAFGSTRRSRWFGL
jgi:sulfide:quinone oxidoreductase